MQSKATCKSLANPGCLKQIMKKHEVAWEEDLEKAELSLAYSQTDSNLSLFVCLFEANKNIQTHLQKGL